MMRQKHAVAMLVLAIGWLFIACSDEDKDPVMPAPIARNIEIGYDNKKEGVIGKDFHFNADVTAGDKIAEVSVRIQQKSGEQYADAWGLELVWEEFEGLKNTNVHKHFTIPEDAKAGKYDFIFTVLDTNEKKLEVIEDFEIINAE